MPTTISKPPAKYRVVEQQLRSEIVSGLWRAGERLPGEHDLARRFGVAYMTLRQAIGCLIDEGLLLRTNGKGTFVADRSMPESLQSLRRPMTLLIPSSGITRDSYYFPELLSGFQSVMQSHGLQIVPFNWEAPEPPANLMPDSAIACLMTRIDHFGLVERLRDAGYPVLAVNRYSGRRTIPCVHIDDKSAVETAIDYLYSLGHRSFGFVKAASANIDARDRLRGFRAAIARHDVDATETGTEFTEASGYAAAREMLAASRRPTAIVCASDLSATGVLRAARELGLSVPSDISVVGFGDFSVASAASPRLTTIRQDRSQLGQRAAESLFRLANDEEIGDVVIPGKLILRESAGPALGT